MIVTRECVIALKSHVTCVPQVNRKSSASNANVHGVHTSALYVQQLLLVIRCHQLHTLSKPYSCTTENESYLALQQSSNPAVAHAVVEISVTVQTCVE